MTDSNLLAMIDVVRERLADTFTPLRVISAETQIPMSCLSTILVYGNTMSEERVVRLARYLGVIL